MAVAVDVVSTTTWFGVTSFSYTHAGGGSPTAVVIGMTSTGLPTTLTYGGTSMGSNFVTVTQPTSGLVAAEFGLGGCATGSQVVAGTFAIGQYGVIGTTTVTGSVTSASPFRTSSSGTSTASNATSSGTATSASATGDLVFDHCAYSTLFGAPLTPGGGQTQRYDLNDTGNEAGIGSTSPGAASVGTSYTTPAGQYFALVCASVQVAASARPVKMAGEWGGYAGTGGGFAG